MRWQLELAQKGSGGMLVRLSFAHCQGAIQPIWQPGMNTSPSSRGAERVDWSFTTEKGGGLDLLIFALYYCVEVCPFMQYLSF